MFAELTEQPMNAQDPALLLGSALYLMTRYGEAPCPQLAWAVTCHLELLSASEIPLKLSDICDRLIDHWQVLSQAASPSGTPAGVLARSAARPMGSTQLLGAC